MLADGSVAACLLRHESSEAAARLRVPRSLLAQLKVAARMAPLARRGYFAGDTGGAARGGAATKSALDMLSQVSRPCWLRARVARLDAGLALTLGVGVLPSPFLSVLVPSAVVVGFLSGCMATLAGIAAIRMGPRERRAGYTAT